MIPLRLRSGTARTRVLALLVLVLALLMVVLVVIPRRRRVGGPAIPPVARHPLKPLHPPFTADRLALLADLKAQRFEALDAQLKAFQAQAEHDPTQEANAHFAFESFSNTNGWLGGPLEQWVTQSPGSYAAHLARAEYLFAAGARARGTRWASLTSQQQFQQMVSLFTEGVKEVNAALKLDPKLTDAYALLVEAAKTTKGPQACLIMASVGLRQVPASFTIRAYLMSCLRPRWGGSYGAMDNFARISQAFAGQNPRLAILKGSADADRADMLGRIPNDKDEVKHEVEAIGLFSKAITEGGDDAAFYSGRAKALAAVRRDRDALQDFQAADRLWPDTPATLVWIAYYLDAAGRHQDALKQLDFASQFAMPSSYDRRLRAQIETELTGHMAQGPFGH
ncbi:MAG TPA: DUF4034 domain-containing protein [Candidatus Binataceae bacterium]|nr:DUF4034 domain-containing protein [Candidatus Binataceae bacterium]